MILIIIISLLCIGIFDRYTQQLMNKYRFDLVQIFLNFGIKAS